VVKGSGAELARVSAAFYSLHQIIYDDITSSLDTLTLHLARTANLTNTTCNGAPPGIDVPAGFSTRGLFGVGPTQEPWDYDTNVDNFTWYDEYITRPVPVLVAAVSEEASMGGVTKVVCIAPDHVREGSRVPPESVNNENAAAGMEWGRKAGMATLVAGVVVMSFVVA
jgi:hypothetical protein